MKITNAYVESYRWEKPRVVTSGRGRGTQKYLYNNLSLVYIETDQGITGVGAGLRTPNFESFKELLINEDPLCIEKIWQKLYATRDGKKVYRNPVRHRYCAVGFKSQGCRHASL